MMVLWHYIRRTSPEKVELRNGTIIHFSGHPHDLITFVLIFLRKDYGDIPKDSIVIDIGANIGAFSLYAAISGAQKVYAFEPSENALKALKNNIVKNGLEEIIIPIQKAVSGKKGEWVKFSTSSSPYNGILKDTKGLSNDTFQKVETTTLDEIINSIPQKNVGILKLDCEGKEFEILENTDSTTYQKIQTIKAEIHQDPSTLLKMLKQEGFEEIETGIMDNFWLVRK